MKKLNHKQSANNFFLTIPEACERYALSRNTVAKIAKNAGAFVKIGRAARINKDTLDKFFLDRTEGN